MSRSVSSPRSGHRTCARFSLQHPVRRPLVRPQRRIRRYLHLPRLVWPAAASWRGRGFVDPQRPFLQRHAPRLRAVPVQLVSALIRRTASMVVARRITSITSSMAPLALLQQLDQRNQQFVSSLRQPVRQRPAARRPRRSCVDNSTCLRKSSGQSARSMPPLFTARASLSCRTPIEFCRLHSRGDGYEARLDSRRRGG